MCALAFAHKCTSFILNIFMFVYLVVFLFYWRLRVDPDGVLRVYHVARVVRAGVGHEGKDGIEGAAVGAQGHGVGGQHGGDEGNVLHVVAGGSQAAVLKHQAGHFAALALRISSSNDC